MAINYATQILIIRYLSKSDYGAFAYALSIAAVLAAAIQLGLDRGLARYLPIYDEEKNHGAITGAIAFVGGLTAALGLMVAVGFWATRSAIQGAIEADPLAMSILAILVVLAPIDGLDNLLVTVLAAFRRTGAIFLRRYVVAPLLKLSVVLLLIGGGGDVTFLAIGYTGAGFLGLVVFASVLGKYLRDIRGEHGGGRRRMPVKQLMAFSLPLLTTDLVFITLNATDAFMLEWFGSTEDVAALRAVQPTARLNTLVLSAFGVLFIPFAARLFARGQHDEIGRRYWQTASWVVVLTLPILCACLLFPNELTGSLLGSDYSESAVVLGILSVGYFIHAMFGYNGMTLNVYGKVRFLVGVNLLAVITNIGLNISLIPRFGPLGAAIGTAGTYLIHNAAKQFGVLRRAGLPGAPSDIWRLYAVVAGLVIASAVIGYGTSLALAVRIAVWIAFALTVVLTGRRSLRIEEAFPGLAKLPLVKRVFS